MTEYQLQGRLSKQCEVKVFILGYIFVKIVRVLTVLIQSDLLGRNLPHKHGCQRIHVGGRQQNNTYCYVIFLNIFSFERFNKLQLERSTGEEQNRLRMVSSIIRSYKLTIQPFLFFNTTCNS